MTTSNERPALYLYNTMNRKKEAFAPISDDAVRLYSCGPTVYDTAHIGNLRAYIFMDSLRRALKRNGYTLKHVMNITDVGHLVSDEDTGEDKMLKGARERNKTPWEIAEEITKIFMDDIAALNIEKPEIIAKATEHIPQMLEMVEALVDKGYGYELSDGIYFDISKFAEYGRLSRLDLDEQMAGARVDVNPDKRHPADFALWIKAPAEHIMQWESRWGPGYPGWHIECSAMSMHYLGDRIDIHTGGIDHIPVHHENEIAQSDAYAGKRVVNTWMHGEFLQVDNGKMSKSLKNNYLVEDLRAKGYSPLAYRYFCLNGHYRSKLNFTWESMRAAAVAYRRFIEGALAHRGEAAQSGAADGAVGGSAGAAADGAADADDSADAGDRDNIASYITGMAESFDAAVNDDLNIPKALGIAWQLIRRPEKSDAIFNLLLSMDEVLGLGLKEAASDPRGTGAQPVEEDVPPEILTLVKERETARTAKDWAKSDELRDLIKSKGYAVTDSKEGAKIAKI
ncbi:MAG: cysteine--tRNA ligase [Oscillospiraceae bacterium]|nr:cysteine--tRNA ligase [Oscillospiraceae bacterium]